MSIVSGSGAAINHTGAGGPLAQTGVVPVGYDGNSYRQLGNGTNYLSATGVYGLTGTETFIDTSIRGFTIGGWFMIDSAPGVASGLISRSAPSPQLGYVVKITPGLLMRFTISVDGLVQTVVSGQLVSLSEWVFIAARFNPSVEMALFVNGVKDTLTVAIPASSFVSTQGFEVGRFDNDNTKIITAKVRDVFICWSALSDAQIETVRTTTAP